MYPEWWAEVIARHTGRTTAYAQAGKEITADMAERACGAGATYEAVMAHYGAKGSLVMRPNKGADMTPPPVVKKAKGPKAPKAGATK